MKQVNKVRFALWIKVRRFDCDQPVKEVGKEASLPAYRMLDRRKESIRRLIDLRKPPTSPASLGSEKMLPAPKRPISAWSAGPTDPQNSLASHTTFMHAKSDTGYRTAMRGPAITVRHLMRQSCPSSTISLRQCPRRPPTHGSCSLEV